MSPVDLSRVYSRICNETSLWCDSDRLHALVVLTPCKRSVTRPSLCAGVLSPWTTTCALCWQVITSFEIAFQRTTELVIFWCSLILCARHSIIISRYNENAFSSMIVTGIGAVLPGVVAQSIFTLPLPYDGPVSRVVDCYWWYHLHADVFITVLSSGVDWKQRRRGLVCRQAWRCSRSMQSAFISRSSVAKPSASADHWDETELAGCCCCCCCDGGGGGSDVAGRQAILLIYGGAGDFQRLFVLPFQADGGRGTSVVNLSTGRIIKAGRCASELSCW